MTSKKQWFSFDPTIHAGHVMILVGAVVTSIITSVGAYHLTTARIEKLELAAEVHARQIERAEERIDQNRMERERSFEKLRDDINRGFMIIIDKLDRKADK